MGAPRRGYRGKNHAIAKLKLMGFDPVDKLVLMHNELEKELAYQRNKREQYEEHYASKDTPNETPKPSCAPYKEHNHYALFPSAIGIAEGLMRYKYARVPETNEIETTMKPPTFNVHLTPPKTKVTEE